MGAKPKIKPQGSWTPEEIAREKRATRARDAHDRQKSPEERLEETVRVSRFMSELAHGTPSDVRT
ncbi:MAG TPA: hypothetical protein VK680_13380 [Solirubrobacteraceae bacterium]|nr:hypothetical protein [Solirubrobacteraceae bacterium]